MGQGVRGLGVGLEAWGGPKLVPNTSRAAHSFCKRQCGGEDKVGPSANLFCRPALVAPPP